MRYGTAGLILTMLLFACTKAEPPTPKKPGCTFTSIPSIIAHAPRLRADDARPDRNEVVFLGDSWTYGAELKRDEAFPQLINAFWREKGIPLIAVNAGMNGKTTEQTVWRLNDVISPKTCAVFLEIGANDWNQQRPLREIRRDYETLIREIRKRGITLFLAEIRVPTDRPGYERRYSESFNALFKELARKYNLALMPDFISSPRREQLFLSDNIHPNRCGHRLLARDVLAFLNSDWIFEP